MMIGQLNPFVPFILLKSTLIRQVKVEGTIRVLPFQLHPLEPRQSVILVRGQEKKDGKYRIPSKGLVPLQ